MTTGSRTNVDGTKCEERPAFTLPAGYNTLVDSKRPVAETEVALRAYEKWLARGRSERSQLQDWLEAESEIGQRQELVRLLTEAEKRTLVEHAVSRILSASGTLSQAIVKIVRALCESLGWDAGEFWLLDDSASALRCIEVWYSPSLDACAFEQDTRRRSFSRGEGLPGRVWANRSLLWIPDLAGDEDFPRASLAAQVGLHAAVGFPIGEGRDFLGVIGFLSRDVRQPDDNLVAMMSSIGIHISQFIQRCWAEEELRRQEAERRIAREIQQSLLPKAMPAMAGLEIAGKLWTADEVGGDCFDVFESVVEGRKYLDVLVADAVGHGIAAALLMAETRAYVRALALSCTDLGRLLSLTNRRLAEDVAPGNFVTLLLMRVDPQTRSLRYASAGHWPAYVFDRQGNIRATFPSTGVPLGIDPNSEYATGVEAPLESGDTMFLFTDGIVEAISPMGSEFGLERTFQIVRNLRHETSQAILDALFRAVGAFATNSHKDDLTAVVIQVDQRRYTETKSSQDGNRADAAVSITGPGKL